MGPAGSGKSTIAHTIARECAGSQQLGSMFCFNRSEASTRKPESLFRNIASDLCTKWPAFRAALSKHLDGNKALCTTTDLDTQFDSFILGPARLVAINGIIVIIIDALDESGTPSARQRLLRMLSERLQELPPGFRFLITTRAEPDIVQSFRDSIRPTPSKGSSTYHLDTEEVDTQLKNDIAKYIQHELQYTSGTPPQLPSDAHLMLAKKAGRLFQWAAVACAYIKTDHPGSEPKDRYEELVQGTHPGLDGLYGTVLECFNREGSRVLQSFKHIMGFILTAVEPLSLPSLLDLLEQLDQDEPLKATTILPYLEPLLSGVGPGDTRPVRPLHSSFFDLLQRAGQNPYFVGTTGHHERLAKSTLRLLQRDLRFNMGNLETSYRLNADLSEAQRAAISDQLSYACKYWGPHLQMSDEAFGHEVADLLKMLFLDRFLFWLEAASLAGIVSFVPHCISSALIRLQVDVTQVARDGIKFVQILARPMMDSAAHVYISALAWAPPNSSIVQRYGSQFPFIPRVCSGGMSAWPSAQVLRGHLGAVESVAFSPDGTRITSGSYDETVRVWDAVTGQPVGDPLVGHKGSVTSVAFSPDGSRIASGSWDKTVRVWDAVMGQAVGNPLIGHDGWVSSVAFSPDGSRIASGSDDRTVRVWDAVTGQPVGDPLVGHKGSAGVTSVAFSPHGSHIVSGSWDKTVRVWDAVTGQPVGDPLVGHEAGVTSVAFSPDGSRIASGSYDKTVRVWDAVTGQPVGDPLHGHEDPVSSVAFSPDGSRIVSGSWDKTVRVWHAVTGQPVGDPLIGHERYVTSVAFSPDGSLIASGSDDKTVRVWDGVMGQPEVRIELNLTSGWIIGNNADYILWVPP
ncbi:WD40 repeat-like protein, partial [Calocera cornea HHB12733]